MAQAPLTFFLNNDAYPLGDALTPLVAAFERPEVAIAGGALFFEDGVTQAAGLVVLRNAHWHYSHRNLPAELAGVTSSRDALGVSGAAMAVRTQWFVESGGFDESFLNGFEDVDLCLRGREQGLPIRYVAQARFAHYEAASAGRFDREAQNERRFYERWSACMASVPRTARGGLGAIAVRGSRNSSALLHAARSDLENALRSFGHPVVPEKIAAWRLVDRRFRDAASLQWFADGGAAPAIAIGAAAGKLATIRTLGAAEVEVPFLPCAAHERAARCGVRPSNDPSCTTVGVVGAAGDVRELGLRVPAVALTPQMLLGESEGVAVACVLHCGLTDGAGFGNVLLAQASLPSIALECEALRAIFADDVAVFTPSAALRDAVDRLVLDTVARERYGRLIADDSRRRFSPRRSAIRVVDMLCAARFGLERPAAALRNTPV
jgi:hypothetical protein